MFAFVGVLEVRGVLGVAYTPIKRLDPVVGAGLPDPTVKQYFLSELAREYELFLPGLVCVAGRLPEHPVLWAWYREGRPPESRPVEIVGPPTTTGVGASLVSGRETAWDTRMTAVPRIYAAAIRERVLQLVTGTRSDVFLAQMYYNQIWRTDWDRWKRKPFAPRPVYPVTAFAVSATDGFYFLAGGDADGLAPKLPKFRKTQAVPGTIDVGRQLLVDNKSLEDVRDQL